MLHVVSDIYTDSENHFLNETDLTIHLIINKVLWIQLIIIMLTNSCIYTLMLTVSHLKI